MSRKRRLRPRRNAGPLAQLGIQAGLPTAVERAIALECSVSHLHHCERGAVMPGLDLIERMAKAYRVKPAVVEVAAHECVVLLERRIAP